MVPWHYLNPTELWRESYREFTLSQMHAVFLLKLRSFRKQAESKGKKTHFCFGLESKQHEIAAMPNTALWPPPSNYCRNTLKTRASYLVLEQNACSVFLECLNYIIHSYLLRYKTSTVQRQTAGNVPSPFQHLLFLICHQYYTGSDFKKTKKNLNISWPYWNIIIAFLPFFKLGELDTRAAKCAMKLNRVRNTWKLFLILLLSPFC